MTQEVITITGETAIGASMELKYWIQILSTVATLSIASVVAYFVARQYKISRDQLRLALFDKRHVLYLKLEEALQGLLRGDEVSMDEIMNVAWIKHDVYFLFGEDVVNYLDTMYTKVIECRKIKIQMEFRKGDDLIELMNAETDLLTWFSEQLEYSQKLFSRYLKLATSMQRPKRPSVSLRGFVFVALTGAVSSIAIAEAGPTHWGVRMVCFFVAYMLIAFVALRTAFKRQESDHA